MPTHSLRALTCAHSLVAEIINDYASTDSERIEYLKSITMVSAHTRAPGWRASPDPLPPRANRNSAS